MLNMAEKISLCELPLEILVEILKNIDGCTLGKCRRVCKKWKEVIDDMDHLWQEMCRKEFRYSSQIAKKTCGNECTWYHIFKNLILWSDLSPYEKDLKEFYKFNTYNSSHALDINYGVLPLKDGSCTVLYDMNLKYIPVVLPVKNCLKFENNNLVTVIQFENIILIQRTVESSTYETTASFDADNFLLTKDTLYFYINRDVYKCSLLCDNLSSKLVTSCDYDIKTIQYNNNVLYLFSDCGQIISISNSMDVSVKPISCPVEWIKQVKHINALDDKNFICYSRYLIKIETDNYQHLYLDFPIISTLFFYADIVLIGSKTGSILLYRLSSQKKAVKPIFEKLADLPEGKIVLKLDVCERPSGPVIIAATFQELYVLELNFFPDEQNKKRTFDKHKIDMYKRLLKIKERLKQY